MGTTSGRVEALQKSVLKELITLVHRGTGSENERKAASIIFKVYKKLGLKPRMHFFNIINDGLYIYNLMYSIGFALVIILLLLKLKYLAMGMYLISYDFLILWPINPIPFMKRLFPAKSQNVYTKIEPIEEAKINLVLFGHYDSIKKMLVLRLVGKIFAVHFRTHLNDHRKMSWGFKTISFLQGPTLIANVSLVVLLFVFFMPDHSFIKLIICIILLLFFLIEIFYMTHGILSEFTMGAGDNATGTSTVISLASYFKQNKLKNTRIYFLNTGSEENITRGVAEFVKKIHFNKKNTFFLNLDLLSLDDILICTGESGDNGKTYQYDKDAVELAHRVINSSEKYKKRAWRGFSFVPSDCTALCEKGYRVIATIASMKHNGYWADYHQHSDLPDKINYNTMHRTQSLAKDIIEAVDKHYISLIN